MQKAKGKITFGSCKFFLLHLFFILWIFIRSEDIIQIHGQIGDCFDAVLRNLKMDVFVYQFKDA